MEIVVLEDEFGNKVNAYRPEKFHIGDDNLVVVTRSGKLLTGSDTKKYRVGKIEKINGSASPISYSHNNCNIRLSFAGGSWGCDYVYKLI